MTDFQSVVLGFIQGLTEFLPVSSSGHLAIVQHFFGTSPPLFVDVCVHVATLCATLLVFRTRIIALSKSALRWLTWQSPATLQETSDRKYLVWIFCSTLVTAVFGLLLKPYVEFMRESIVWVTLFLMLNGILLSLQYFVSFRRENIHLKDLPLRNAFWIGAAQSFALFPGISRSGMTIMASLSTGLSRKNAGEYAFLISIPAILGAFVLTLKDGFIVVDFRSAVLSFVTAFVSGYICLKLFLKWVEQGKLWVFGIYCCLMSLLLFISTQIL